MTAEKEREEAHASRAPADYAITVQSHKLIKGRRGYMHAVAEKKEKQTGWQLGNPIGNAALCRSATPVPTPQGTESRRSSCNVVSQSIESGICESLDPMSDVDNEVCLNIQDLLKLMSGIADSDLDILAKHRHGFLHF